MPSLLTYTVLCTSQPLNRITLSYTQSWSWQQCHYDALHALLALAAVREAPHRLSAINHHMHHIMVYYCVLVMNVQCEFQPLSRFQRQMFSVPASDHDTKPNNEYKNTKIIQKIVHDCPVSLACIQIKLDGRWEVGLYCIEQGRSRRSRLRIDSEQYLNI
jgi:hypothetical protein